MEGQKGQKSVNAVCEWPLVQQSQKKTFVTYIRWRLFINFYRSWLLQNLYLSKEYHSKIARLKDYTG